MKRDTMKLLSGQLHGLLVMDSSEEEIGQKVKELADELKRCSKCNRPLVVLQPLDYYLDDVCGLCQR